MPFCRASGGIGVELARLLYLDGFNLILISRWELDRTWWNLTRIDIIIRLFYRVVLSTDRHLFFSMHCTGVIFFVLLYGVPYFTVEILFVLRYEILLIVWQTRRSLRAVEGTATERTGWGRFLWHQAGRERHEQHKRWWEHFSNRGIAPHGS